MFVTFVWRATPHSLNLSYNVYADDTTLFQYFQLFIPCNGNVSYIINTELDKVSTWLKANKLSLNIKKTKFMLFYKPLKQISMYSSSLEIDNIKLDYLNEFSFLGLYLDKLEKTHTDKFHEKCLR